MQGAVEWVVADALNPSALASAFEGADAVFFLNPVSIGALDTHAEADRLSASIAEALTTASVPYAVALSSQGAHLRDGTGVVKTLHRFEAALAQTGVDLTFLRPAYFLESWVPLGKLALETGEFLAFLDPLTLKIDAVSTRDVGMIAAHHLMNPNPGVVNIVGPARYSDADAAETIDGFRTRPVRIIPMPSHQIAAAHEAAGIGRSLAAETAAMYHAINGPGIQFESGSGRYETGVVTLPEVLQTLAEHPLPQ